MHLFTIRKIDGNLKKLGRTSTTRAKSAKQKQYIKAR